MYRPGSNSAHHPVWHRLQMVVLALLLVIASSCAIAEESVPDLSGVWLATSPRSALMANRPEFTERAQADLESHDPLSDPVLRCVPPGFPRSGFIVYPIEIVQTDKLMVILYESFGMIRRVYLDGREPPEYLPPSIMGYSLGRWEDDELVVETTNVAPGLLSGSGIRQYGDVSVVERFRLGQGNQVLTAEVVVTAPQTFLHPWQREFTWALDPDGMIYESVCDPLDSRFAEPPE